MTIFIPVMWLRYLAPICTAVLVLASCEDERVSGEVVGPLVGPRVAESVLALEVVDGVPAGITDVFRVGELVNLWVHWERLRPPHSVDVAWIDPSGSSLTTTVDIEAPASEQVTVSTLELTGFSATGRWEVELYLDAEFMRSHSFLVVGTLPGE
jgi:hypothetical protein